ncbi:MAG: T9SS type A sorting domain-containing protein, partial [candidate division Zixibacteria bacterium]|nr:T9SS type A sorting domain-containing protein [candidate division Zixibacteria bacterium]
MPYMAADAALFGSYFFEGESVFDDDRSRQIAATDINKDGQSLKLEDLVQLGRIRLHEIHPDSTNDITIYGDNYIANDRDFNTVYLNTKTPIPVLWLKFFGEVAPINENPDYIVISNYDGLYTRVIVAAYGAVDSGSLFLFDYQGKGDLVGAQASNLWGHEISTYYYNCGFGTNCRMTLDIGDINLNGLSCEIADWVIFSNYFLNGEQVFTIDPGRQIYNTDVNLDSIFLTIEDFVFMSTHLIGGPSCAEDFDTTSSNIATFQQNTASQTISISTADTLGAIWLIFNGDITAAIIDTNLLVAYVFDHGQTRVLIYPRNPFALDSNFILSGSLISYSGSGQLVEAHTATNKAVKVNSVIDVATDINDDSPNTLPTVFALHQNYPNPFNIETTIKFDLPGASEVRFEIINILGQIVYNVTNRYSAGSHTIFWDGSSNSGQTVGSGVYYYRIIAGDFVSSKKMMLL